MKRFSLDMTDSMAEVVEGLCEKQGITKSEMLRSAIALYLAVKKGEQDGEQAALTKDGEIVARLIGH